MRSTGLNGLDAVVVLDGQRARVSSARRSGLSPTAIRRHSKRALGECTSKSARVPRRVAAVAARAPVACRPDVPLSRAEKTTLRRLSDDAASVGVSRCAVVADVPSRVRRSPSAYWGDRRSRDVCSVFYPLRCSRDRIVTAARHATATISLVNRRDMRVHWRWVFLAGP